MDNIVPFPIIPRVVLSEEANVIEDLRKSIQACVKKFGSEPTKEMLLAAVGIADTNDWRNKARRNIDGDRKS